MHLGTNTIGISIIAICLVIIGKPTPLTAFQTLQSPPAVTICTASSPFHTLGSRRYDGSTPKPRRRGSIRMMMNIAKYRIDGIDNMDDFDLNGNTSHESRRAFFRTFFTTGTVVVTSVTYQPRAMAFEGGVGGLGKTKPETGIVYANTDVTPTSSNLPLGSSGTDFSAELLTPDGTTTAFLSFYPPWPMMRSSGIESRDYSNPEAVFVQVAPLALAGKNVGAGDLPTSFFSKTLFGAAGKYGAYGTPTDIRVKKNIEPSPQPSTTIYTATFTTLTPSMIESDRKALIAVSVVGDGVFMLVAGTTAARFKKQVGVLGKAAESFSCVEAPKTGLRR